MCTTKGVSQMVEPITASYVEDEDDWTITVAGAGRELTARAPGLIAARDRADQLVEKLVPDHEERAVVHVLNGSALDFTAKYIQVRMATPSDDGHPETQAPTGDGAEGVTGEVSPDGAEALDPGGPAEVASTPEAPDPDPTDTEATETDEAVEAVESNSTSTDSAETVSDDAGLPDNTGDPDEAATHPAGTAEPARSGLSA